MNFDIIWIIVKILICIVMTWLTVEVINKLFKSTVKSQGLHIQFIRSILVFTVYIFGGLTTISFIPGASSVLDKILASSGVIAIIVGLAAQESFGNIVSGILLVWFKPFDVGDRVRIIDYDITGKIEDISLRNTVIRTFTNSRIIVPNSKMGGSIVENSNIVDEKSSNFIDVSVAYESDLRKAMDLMAEIIGSHPLYLDIRTPEEIEEGVPKVKVFVRAFGASGIDLRASVWTSTIDMNFEACSDIRLQIKETFEKEGIEIPYDKVQVLQS